MTAGHNLYNEETSEWFERIIVTPGKNGQGIEPFGKAESTEFYSVKGWVDRQLDSYDYGCIILPADRALGDEVGWFGYDVIDDVSLRSATCNIAGYPGTIEERDDPVHSQLYDANIVRDADAMSIYYLTDTYEGQSGAPVWRTTEYGPIAIGVHGYGDVYVNSATRIIEDVADNMDLWRQI